VPRIGDAVWSPLVSDAIDNLRRAVKQSPENAPLRSHLGDLLAAAGRYDEALSEYQAALAREPSADLQLAVAKCFLALGRIGEATVLIEHVLNRDATSVRARLLHCRLLLNVGDIERARDEYRRAIALDPTAIDPDLGEMLTAPDTPAAEQLPRYTDDEAMPASEAERPGITFEDVGGMEEVKEQVRLKIVHPLMHPELYAAFGKQAGGGILLYGPPGCGKTHLARATAGEIGSEFIAVGIDDVLDMYLGEAEQKLHLWFEQARRSAPCVLFFDEIDALGARRADMRGSAGRQLINQFLAELDGIKSDNEGVLVLGATNAPWHVDDAFRRPGRFDRVIFVPPPDRPARAAILRLHLRRRPQEAIDVDEVAAGTDGFSGADLQAVVDEAVEARLAESLRDGVPRPLRTKDLRAAARKRRATTAEWFATARNYVLHANQGGSYDEIAAYLRRA
jgi:SpoVK/Ycf46/Vps4 family AAA+-type ATPase